MCRGEWDNRTRPERVETRYLVEQGTLAIGNIRLINEYRTCKYLVFQSSEMNTNTNLYDILRLSNHEVEMLVILAMTED